MAPSSDHHSSAGHRLASLAGLLCLLAAALLPGPADRALAQETLVVVEGDYLGENGLANRPKAESAFRAVCTSLRLASVPFTATRDSLVETKGLPGSGVAVFPYSRAMTAREVAQVLSFVDRGGKVILCFIAPPALLAVVGARVGGLRGAEARGGFDHLRLCEELPGVAPLVKWRPGLVVAATAEGATRVVANWETRAGAAGALPAVLLGERGAFLSGVPTTAGRTDAALWRALVGTLAPGLWPRLVPTDPAALGPFGRFASLTELASYLRGTLPSVPALQPAVEHAEEALSGLAGAREDLAQGRAAEALDKRQTALNAAHAALWESYPPLAGELRGVWMQNTAAPSWPEAMKALARANLNAAFPYMMSGGVAFYNSKVLAVHPSVREEGDYLTEAVCAATAAGVPLHARMLNLTTLFAPAEVRRTLERQGRLMRNSRGATVDWLCPANAANRKAQVAAALEMASYGVAGIQFDYLRYPGADSCYCPTCRRKFEHDLGVRTAHWPQDVASGGYRGRFADWRRRQLTEVVAEISRAVRQAYPRVYVSAAVFLNWEDHRETFGQDWKAWIDEGLVDFVCPMDYTTNDERFRLYVSRQEKWIGGKVPYAAGIGVYADGYHFSGPLAVLEQVRIAREHGSQGFVIFNYSEALVRDYLPWLRLGATREPTSFSGPANGNAAR